MDHAFSNFAIPKSTTMIVVLNTGDYAKQEQQPQQQQKLRKPTLFRLFCTLFYLGWWWSCLFSCCCRSQAIAHNKTLTQPTAATSAINSQKWSTQHTLSPSTTQSISDDDEQMMMMMKSTVINGTHSWYLNKNNTKGKQQESKNR